MEEERNGNEMITVLMHIYTHEDLLCKHIYVYMYTWRRSVVGMKMITIKLLLLNDIADLTTIILSFDTYLYNKTRNDLNTFVCMYTCTYTWTRSIMGMKMITIKMICL